MPQRIRHQLSAAVFVALMRGDRVCLLRRRGTGWMDGYLSLPAGTLEAQETILAAAVREAHEEVGVDIARENLKHAHVLHSLTDGADWTGHFFVATAWSGEPRICEPEKHAALCWRDMSGLPSDVIPYVHQSLMSIRLGVPYSEFGWTERVRCSSG